MENLKVLLEEKVRKTNILEEKQSKNETAISVIKEEIENYKNKNKKFKQTQLNKKHKKSM